MKSIRNIGLLVFLLALAPSVLRAGTWGAKPEHGKTYLISVGQDTKNVLTPYKYSWLRDTGLAFLTYAEGNDAQKWKLIAVSGKQDCYQLVNGDGELAFDMALNDTKKVSGYPCMWTQSIANPNQQIYITKKGSGYMLSAVSARNGQTYYVTFGSISSVNGYYCGYENSEASAATLQFKEVPAVVIPEGADWENAKVYERNKERAHATYMPYPSTKAMKADGQRYDKPWLDPTGANYLSLNGTWKLRWSEGAKPVLLGKDDFWGDGVSTEGSAWNDITVPSCLEMNGYGLPMYVNVDYPFEDQQPYVRMKAGLKNSVGSYRRDFTLPAGWENKRVFLHFDGIYSAAYVYVNGNEVGYTEGANNVSEFDITKYLRTGKNNVAVQVIRWSDGSYLEGQDMWHMSGIHRDVYLVATPKTYLADHYIKATVTPGSTTVATGSAATSVDLTVCNRDKTAAKKTVTVTLFDPSGKEVKKLKSDFVFAAGDSLKTQTVDFGTLSNVKLWSAETPTLYTFTFSQSQDGKEEEAFSTKYGFRKIDLSKGYLEVNGRRTYLKGANTQDTDPLHGRSISTDLMLKDIAMMKQSNMNTVRTSHYPRQAKMMAMFDHYGLFVVDEADMELHKNWDGVKTIINNTDWTGAIVDRNVRNTLRDRNHPSVVFWSLGNESGSGLNIMAAYNAVRKLDNRYIHYEGSTRDNAEGTDLHSVMYPAVDHSRGGTTGSVISDANHPSTGKPYFMCEYAHAMGNAVGNLREYWEAIEGSRMGVGGCIWDWVDQSIYSYDAIKNNQLTKNGFPAYITGYDCPGPHQYNFVNNGLVNADRAWSAELDEVKRIYQWVGFDLNKDSRQVKLTNKYLDRNLNQFYLKWTLLADGKPVQDGIVKKLNCAAGGTETVDLKYNPTAFAGKELFLNIGLYTKEATNWCDRDYPVAEFQQQLTQRTEILPAVDNTKADALHATKNSDGGYTYANGKQKVTFDGQGNITLWAYEGKDLFMQNEGPRFDRYRWIENDNPMEAYGNDPTDNGVKSQTATFQLSDDGKTATVNVTQNGNYGKATYKYTINANGTIDLTSSFEAQGNGARRLGFSLNFPSDMSKVRYYARGPRASYIDRLDGEDFGLYETTVKDMYEPFAHPQSNGNRIGLRWLTLTNNEGNGVKVETSGDVAFSLTPWTEAELRTARHEWELPTSNRVVAHFDAIQQGLGNKSCGPGPLSKYEIQKGKTYSNIVRFIPFSETADDTPDGISAVVNSATTMAQVYDLSGRRLPEPPAKGFYIQSGKVHAN
ncbi:glycoside hydrolase family 2 TIM barrel-domain containing protein [Prevotella sp.]|uniref:glycoside hydrolase family 2 TIM barrel-domain containing protein n=1 Tax=Prevotella sp. TaxID=59823 RepID=UPI0025794F19|nr:glycoside hydrolase family 2 TIM barrel-domain containing protein [Prevotella sp.]